MYCLMAVERARGVDWRKGRQRRLLYGGGGSAFGPFDQRSTRSNRRNDAGRGGGGGVGGGIVWQSVFQGIMKRYKNRDEKGGD
jgi:hypothetical protein